MAPRPRTTTSYATGICDLPSLTSSDGEMPRAPFADRGDDRHEATAHRRQAVVDLGRHGAVVATVDQAGGRQGLELAAQDAGRDLRRAVAAAQHAAPELKGKIGYRCMKGRDGADYYHLATVFDDTARVALQERAFFKHYTEATRTAAGGSVEVLPLEMIAETAAAA